MTDMIAMAQVEGSMWEGVGWMVTITEEGWKEITSKAKEQLAQILARVGISYWYYIFSRVHSLFQTNTF